MSPMFNACMQNAGNPGPPNHLGPPQSNGPPPQNFYSPNPPAPHQFNNNQAPPHPINSFNNNQIRNIAPRPPNFYSTFEYRIYEFTKRLADRPDVSATSTNLNAIALRSLPNCLFQSFS